MSASMAQVAGEAVDVILRDGLARNLRHGGAHRPTRCGGRKVSVS